MQINDHHINENQNSIFCPPEPGKPNPYEDRVIGQFRSRIVRHGQKGDTCVYTAMQILLDEAKNPKYQRNHGEKLLSNHRKELTEWSKKWRPIQELIAAINIGNTRCTKATAPFLLQVLEKRQEKPGFEQVQKFCEQQTFDDFAHYVNFLKEEDLDHIHTKLFDEMHYSSDKIDEYSQSTFSLPWELVRNPYAYLSKVPQGEHENLLQTTTHIRAAVAHGLYFQIAKEVYDLEVSSWNPEQPITALIKELELHGPHLVSANLGKGVYKSPPIRLKDKIEGRTIYGWAPNAERIDEGHAIVIVGAEALNQNEYIYFLDPNTTSYDRDTQEIFKVSYKRFLSSIMDLRHRRVILLKNLSQQDKLLAPIQNGYALYCPRNKNII